MGIGGSVPRDLLVQVLHTILVCKLHAEEGWDAQRKRKGEGEERALGERKGSRVKVKVKCSGDLRTPAYP